MSTRSSRHLTNVPGCRAEFTVALSTQHSPSAVYSLGYYGNYQAISYNRWPFRANLQDKKTNCGLTAYIQPGVACGHASHVDGRESVPTSIRLHHPLYQQALPAGAILIQTVERRREIQIITRLNAQWSSHRAAGATFKRDKNI